MPELTRDHAAALADYARHRRGWDTAGSLAILGRVKGRNADDVAMAWIRFCADDTARTPGAFPNPRGPHWAERIAPPEPLRPPRPDEACQICGRHHDRCLCDQPQRRPPTRSQVAAEHLRTLRGITAAARADLCPCGVPTRTCADHRHPEAPQ